MYYWIVILFSLVTIMTYKMAARQDDFDRRTVPSMEASVASIVHQHKAALAYVKTITYEPNVELDRTQYQSYGAKGLNYKKSNEDYAYKSIVFCVDMTDGSKTIACNSPGGIDFLVTYGDVPNRWRDDSIEGYFLTVLGRYTGRKSEIGIVEAANPATSGVSRGSTRVINSAAGRQVYVPPMFECVENVDSIGKFVYVSVLTAGVTNDSEDVFVANPSGVCELSPP